MEVKEHVVTNFGELHEECIPYREVKKWIFRGQSDEKYPLQAKAGRPEYCEVNDALVFESWKRRAIEYISFRPNNDWDWLAIAQHHGLATRLLDWSFNPLSAAFFAVRGSEKANGVVYAARFKKRVINLNIHPMEYKSVRMLLPTAVVPRISRQGGLFTIHPNPKLRVEEEPAYLHELHKIVIPAKHKQNLLSELAFYGVNSATLFPDLDGLSAFVNWSVTSKEYWRDIKLAPPTEEEGKAG